jgi:hypothetical protein
MKTYIVVAQNCENGALEPVAFFYNAGDATVYRNLNKEFYYDLFINVRTM